MKKNALLEAWLDSWEAASTHGSADKSPAGGFPREYRAYFFCFNRGEYYEAHDVLEHLWLRCADSNRSFYQALIQFAGAFVHFQKQARAPGHPTHSRRLAPGARLLDLAAERLSEYPGLHKGLDLAALLQMCAVWKSRALSDPCPLANFEAPVLELCG